MIPKSRVLDKLDSLLRSNDYPAAKRLLQYWLSEAEYTVNCKKKICSPHTCGYVGNFIKRKPADENDNYALGDNVGIKGILVAAEFGNKLFSPENVSGTYPARIQEVSTENLEAGGCTHSLKGVEEYDKLRIGVEKC